MIMDEILEVKICDEKVGFSVDDVVDIGVNDYNRLNNRPAINDVVLEGNKTGADLGLIDKPLFDESVKNLNDLITTETKNRESADSELTDSINAEVARAKEQEQALQAAIDDEASERASADSELQQSISNEEAARKSADSELQTNIDTEKDERVSADNEIRESLNDHISNTSNPHNVVASQVKIADSGNKFSSTNVEGALQELASGVASKVDDVVNADGTSIVDSDKKAQLKNAIVKEAGKVTKSVRFGGSLAGGGASSVLYDGSKDTSVNMDGDDFVMGGASSETTQSVLYALKKTGATAGFYQGITIDEKGRITAAQDMKYATKQEVQEIAAGKAKTFPYDDYQKFVAATNALPKTAMNVSDNVLIKTLNVPDMWVTRVNAVSTQYVYTTDQDIIDKLNTTYGLTVGYFTFSQLETTKVDLEPYQTKTDNTLVTSDKTVVGAINEVKGVADGATTKSNTNAAVIKDIQDGNVAVGEAKKVQNSLWVGAHINSDAGRIESLHAYDGSSLQKISFADQDFTGVDTTEDGMETLAISLANTGVKSGSYNAVRVDAKGRVIDGNNKDYVEADTNSDITGIKKFTNEQGLMTNAIENLNGNRVYDFDSTNNRFGSLANPTHIRGSEARPKYETDGESGSTVKKDIALVEDVPTVGNGTLTIQKNGSDVATFSANQSGNTTANIAVPKVVQSTGTSENDVMSQKAVTDEFGKYVDKSSVQTIEGAKTFTGGLATDDLQPTTDQSVDIGSTTKRFGHAYVSGEIQVYSADKHRISFIDTDVENGTNPSVNKMGQTIYYDKNNVFLSAWRGVATTAGRVRADLMARSFGTTYTNYVALLAEPNATSANAADTWHFIPNLNNVHDLGYSTWRWKNGYITNLQYVKVINGGGGNAMLQQNSDTSGADITVGSNTCNLKIQGKAARPTYRQGTGSYANLALQSDIPTIPAIPYDGNGLSTGTLGGTTYFLEPADRMYFEKTVGGNLIAGVLLYDSGSYGFTVPVLIGSAINYARVVWKSEQKTITIDGVGQLKTVYYPQVLLYNSSGGTVTNSSYTTGTFQYKSLRYN